jgi:hypothetical protein
MDADAWDSGLNSRLQQSLDMGPVIDKNLPLL